MNKILYTSLLLCFFSFAITSCGNEGENGANTTATADGPDFSKFIGSFEEPDIDDMFRYIHVHNKCIITEEDGKPFLRVLNVYTGNVDKAMIWLKRQYRPMKAGDTATQIYEPMIYDDQIKSWTFNFLRQTVPVSLKGDSTLILDMREKAVIYKRVK